MKKFVLTFTLIMLASYARAYDTKIGGIYYDLITKAKMAVVAPGDEKYTGEITIPETVEYDGITYTVTSVKDHSFNPAGSSIEVRLWHQ